MPFLCFYLDADKEDKFLNLVCFFAWITGKKVSENKLILLPIIYNLK